jgi:ribosomal protein S18 acetylase RimI-like enzyme
LTIVDSALVLRPVEPADEAFLLEVYASTRADELALTFWTDEQKAAFVGMQFRAQKSYYEANYPGAEFKVILDNEERVGRLYTHRTEGDLRVMDIAILPLFRRRGIGSTLLRDLQRQASLEGRKVGIHVEIFNPAMSLYERLGFEKVTDRGVYHFMQWTPPV